MEARALQTTSAGRERRMLHYLQELFRALDFSSIGDVALRAVAVLLCLTVHETCHGLAALALGDPTAKSQHRLSLDPLRHIDWFGLLMMFTVGFGWAKPVPVDPRYFRHPKRGMALTALAGPLSNFALALALLGSCRALLTLASPPAALLDFLVESSILSVGLGVFNLLPVPPLDGSKVLGAFLPDRAYGALMRYERYGLLALLALTWLGIGDGLLSRGISAVWSALFDFVF